VIVLRSDVSYPEDMSIKEEMVEDTDDDEQMDEMLATSQVGLPLDVWRLEHNGQKKSNPRKGTEARLGALDTWGDRVCMNFRKEE
jgi:hypothetical protein